MKLSKEKVKEITDAAKLEYAAVMAIIDVESPGVGFDQATGKLLIQFEPAWFKRREPYAPSGLWSVNGVERQAKEWAAFNSAFKEAPDSAMQSTSIGLPQIMGMHYSRLGYGTVGDMWDDFKKGEDRQIAGLCRFIKTSAGLYYNLKNHEWHGVAVNYNGKYYRNLATKLGREPYNYSLNKAYDKHALTFEK